MKNIYAERADDLRILAGKEPDFAAGIHSPHNACAFRENCRQAEAEIARLRKVLGWVAQNPGESAYWLGSVESILRGIK